MTVTVRDASDASRLRELVRAEANSKQRDRFRAVLLAVDGEAGAALAGDEIARRVGRSPRFVDQWLARYRRGGLAALYPKRARGRPRKLPAAAEPAFKARLLGGPTAADGGVCTLRGAEARAILRAEFGVEMTLGGVYALMHRLNLSCLRPRPRHRKNDPAAMAEWLAHAPRVARELSAADPGRPLEWWFQDEARLGQQGTLTAVWAERGSRPAAVKQTEYEWVYLYAAVNPATGASSAMLAPTVNTAYMNEHLTFISRQVAPGAHAILVLDGAGWHVAKALAVPANLTLLHLPPYSPELNPVERVWAYLRSHYLGNRVFKDYDELFEVVRAAWNCLDEARLRSICHTAWIERAI